MIVLLAGRAAERAVMAAASVGAGGDDPRNDLAIATGMMVSMHASCAMGDSITYLGTRREAMAALRTDHDLRARVERDIQELQSRADRLIQRQRAAVVAIAVALRERRHLTGEAVRAIFLAHVAPLLNPL